MAKFYQGGKARLPRADTTRPQSLQPLIDAGVIHPGMTLDDALALRMPSPGRRGGRMRPFLLTCPDCGFTEAWDCFTFTVKAFPTPKLLDLDCPQCGAVDGVALFEEAEEESYA
jgi:hypothetical protein